jgi:Permuted papain-like amidase enzyme, YaeF/YiiX, C92 family
VLEAVQTTRATPLPDWIARGQNGDAAIYRLEELTEAQANAVTTAARSHFGKPYDVHFHASRDRLYCSELVQIAFLDGAGLQLGREETLQDLNLGSAAALALVAQRWDSHPDCRDGQAADATGCLAIIRDNPLVTPKAQAADPQLTLIYSSY